MRLVLVGVPGSGKSTIVKRIQEKMDVAIADVGSLVLEHSKKYGVSHRDEIRTKLTPAQFKKVQEEARKSVVKMKGNVIIDTHVAIKSSFGYIPGFPENIVKKLRPDVFVLLEFDPRDIHRRRKSDKSRRRDEETPEEIDLHQHINRYYAASAASQCNAALKIVLLREKQKYPYAHTEKAAEEVIKVLRNNK